MKGFLQAITPNPNVPCRPGWCLTYLDDCFDLEAHGKQRNYPTATAAWEASQYKHRDHDFPEGCWVPVWFSLSNVAAGHVALRAPDGAIWSSSHPTSNTPVRHASLDALYRYYGAGRLGYLGWTEDLTGILVIKQGGDMPITTDHVRKGFQMSLMRVPDSGEVNNEKYQENPGLFIDTLWNNGGEYNFNNRLFEQDLLNFMGAVYKLDIADAGVKKKAKAYAGLGWKKAMYQLAADYGNSLMRKDQAPAAGEAEKKLQAIKDALK